MMNNIFESLNEQQQLAASTTEGRIRIVAGAGSGKTRVLAHRYAYLVNDIGIEPANILCMTFTNKAAQEMRSRIAKMVGRTGTSDFICTIHGFCVKLLREEIQRIGYPRNFVIIDDDDAKQIAVQVMQEHHIDRSKSTVSQLLGKVGACKRPELHYIESLIVPHSTMPRQDFPPEVVRFIELQRKCYALDFDDLIEFALYILDRYPDARERWQQQMNYVMVDEVQDCNERDWRLIDIIAQRHGNLFVVGDPDQAIYEWRGACPKMFVDFNADTDVILNQNYRSTPNILDVANSIIAHNVERVPKDLFTHNASGRKVMHMHARCDEEECGWVASEIKALVKRGADYNHIAVLYRATHLSRALEQALLKHNIKYTIWGGVRFFERREIKDALAYLRLVESDDDLALQRVVNTPPRKFGKVSMHRLTALAEAEKASLLATLRSHLDDFGNAKIRHFVALIDHCRRIKDVTAITDLLDHMLKTSGLEDLYRNDGDEERLENITELIDSIRHYELAHQPEDLQNIHTYNPQLGEFVEQSALSAYLQDIALYTNADYKSDGATVKLMTVHQAKGLEFPYVFVVGLSEGIFPNHRAIRERRKAGEEEERRLMYVAVTRAKQMLYLTDSEGFNASSRTEKFPSRFFGEIDDSLIELKGHIDPELLIGTQLLVDRLNDELGLATPSGLAVGARVQHKVFGTGTIVAVSGTACTVAFGPDQSVVRTLQARVLTPLG